MTELRIGSCGVMALLAIGVSAQATTWTNDFSNFTGTNLDAVSTYTDTGGGNPSSYTVTFRTGMGSVTQTSPWLYQGDIGGGNKTAAFFNEVGTGNGRVRFSTALPTSADLNGGIVVDWGMRVGFTNTTRGPFQIAGTAGGTVGETQAFNAYIRLRNSPDNAYAGANSYIDIQRNGGGLYKDLTLTSNQHLRVDRLILPNNIGDEFHDWSAEIIRNPIDNMAYWKLWLDGSLLLFDGAGGSPMYNSQQYSFRTFEEGFGGVSSNDPYIGLGDLNSQDSWEFEFDYVNFSDVPEPGTLTLLGCGIVLLYKRRR